MNPLQFKIIDIDNDLAIATGFREDSYVVSYGNKESFHGVNGRGAIEYEHYLRSRLKRFPLGHVHVWKDDDIIGQIECKPRDTLPCIGYVNLIYLRSDHRSKGLAPQLQSYIVDLFTKMDCSKMQLRVNHSNHRAIRFYTRMGWETVQQQATNSPELLMEKNL